MFIAHARRTSALRISSFFACLLAVACSSDKSTQAPPNVTAGTAAPAGTSAPSTAGASGGAAAAGRGGTPGAPTGAAGVGGARPPAMAGMGMTPPVGGAAGMPPAPTAGAPAMPPGGAGEASVTQFHGNAKRDGHYVDAAFTRAAAATLKKDPNFTAMTSGRNYAQPLFYDAGPGGKDLVIAATQQNEVTAFDAMSGMVVWRQTIAEPVRMSALPCGNIDPLGVTGTPVIDPATKTLYVAAMTPGPKHQIFALSLDDGATKQGWPVDVSTVTAGSTRFNSATQNQRGGLILVGDMLYVPYGGHWGDCSDYRGWVVGVPVNNPAAPVAFATAAYAGGIWAPGGLASDGTSVFAATGNTMSQPNNSGFGFTTPSTWGHGNAILRLGKDLKTIEQSATTDFFAAQNWSELDRMDLDLGGSGPLLLDVPGATPSELVMAMGKDGVAYLLDRTNLGGMGGEIEFKMVARGSISEGLQQAAAAYQTPSGTFVAFRPIRPVTDCPSGSGNLGVMKIEAASPPSMTMAWCAAAGAQGSPIVTTTDGKSESIVWVLADGKLLGFNGEDGSPVYAGGGAMDNTGAVTKFQTPIAAKGRIYVGTNMGVVAFTLQ